KLKEEGLINHICISSHLIRDQIKELLMEGIFEGVLFGYSAYNFKTRQLAFDAIREKHLGAVIMNPLGGGLIPENPQMFNFLKQEPDEGTVAAALRFLWDHREISSTIVGFDILEHVNEALAAMETYKPRSVEDLAAVKEKADISFEGICTGCGYCDDCPVYIPIPKYMDAYNQKILGKPNNSKNIIDERLYWHWGLNRKPAARCTACGQCEKMCTQHLNIIERLKEIVSA
ncbi:MAG: aldo/keto reductase, partial [Treponema sp.]|nr:aldo/keto reductase [Treponema sp.]